MTRDELFKVISAAVVDVLMVEADQVTLEANFKDDLDADSLALVEVIMAIEDQLDLSIPEDELKGLATVGDALNLLADKLAVTA